MHHKEIGLVVDTAKIILNSMPTKARLIVSGIGKDFSINDLLYMRYTPLKTWYNIDNSSIDNLLYLTYTPLKREK